MSDIDLDAYLERIGTSTSVAPNLITLQRVLRDHMTSIPFDNIDILLERSVQLDVDSVQRKLVQERRGGHCFEHVTLLAAALTKIGFELSCHLARVLMTAPKTEAPRTHMFALVSLPQGRFAVDPGLGGASSMIPVPLTDTGSIGSGQRSRHWFARSGREWILRTQGGERDLDLWASELADDYPVDFMLANHFIATSPQSSFRKNLMMNLFSDEGRVSVFNDRSSINNPTETKTSILEDEWKFFEFNRDNFSINREDCHKIYSIISKSDTPI